ncbi:MAG TPA: hypothetical protein VNL97_08110 [Solirubrobacterales bacterium]|nr:hypothetical protein [Solirubrobacterales bacterium]
MKSASFHRYLVLIAAATALTLVTACAVAGAAWGKSEVLEFSTTPSTTQAGGHPDIFTHFALGNRLNQESVACECNDPKDVTTHVPAGVIANPHVVTTCTVAELASVTCSADAQMGFVAFRLGAWVIRPLYQVTPASGEGARLAFLLPLINNPQYTAINARTGGDFGLDFRITGITHLFTPPSFNILFWGVPGDPAHDILRFTPGEEELLCRANPISSLTENVLPGDCVARGELGATTSFTEHVKQPVASSLPIAPYTEAPTSCVGPQVSSIDVLAYDGEETHAESPWPATTGCDKLSFNPSLSATPTTSEADSASGLAVEINVPQFEDPNTPSPAEIKANTVTLPAGFSINSSAADGKSFCTDAQANFGNEEAAACPEFSKVGTTTVESASLPRPIHGYIYIGEPRSGDRYRVIVTASGFGTNVKIAGSTHPDPETGQIVTSFPTLPQAPFERYGLHFFGSERGLFATPTQCGTYEVKSTFEPWASELSNQTSVQFFKVISGPGGSPCPNGPRPFSPALAAGVEDNTAAAHSPFVLQLSRADGEQNLSALAVRTPPGFSADLSGIPYCPEEAIASLHTLGHTALLEQASPACPQASQIGSAIAGAGAGTHPLYVGGKVYLAGPYKGAPLSLVVVVPALSGPYDLGVVAVRAALQVDPDTAQVTTISDPLPQILEGIPLRTRFIRVSLDRTGFALNPTNCEPLAVQAQIAGTEGALAEPTTHFQVANCANLGFEPKLRLRFSGSTKRAGNPGLSTTLIPRGGDANFKSARVILPKAELIDNEHIAGPCTRVQFNADQCPPSSILGTARAESPLLDAALEGPVYLRSNPDRELPDVVADLHGQIHVVLVGHTDQVKDRIRSSFETLPDVPVSAFSLRLAGGKTGILQSSESLCKEAQKAKARFTGQNGKVISTPIKVAVAGCKKKAAKRKRHNRAKAGRAGR